jgi:hypothetical protein
VRISKARSPYLSTITGFLFIPLAVLFVGYTVWSENTGIRYLIPVLPFVYLVAGLGLETLLRHCARGGSF